MAIVAYTLPSGDYGEITEAGLIVALAGAFPYTAAGPDYAEADIVYANGTGKGNGRSYTGVR
jgi:hypothetical protein